MEQVQERTITMTASPQATNEGSRYGFHDPAVLRNVPPPVVRFERPLRWWSLDRSRRRMLATALRDQRQQAILRLSDCGIPDNPMGPERHRASHELTLSSSARR